MLRKQFNMLHNILLRKAPYLLSANFTLVLIASIFILIAIYSALDIGIKNHLTIDNSPEGYTYFFQTFDGPIKLLTAATTLIILYVTFFRMKQTNEQLSELKKNNQFNNYYIHKEAFLKDFNSFPFHKFCFGINENLVKAGVYGPRHPSLKMMYLEIGSFAKSCHGYFYGKRPDLFSISISDKAVSALFKPFGELSADFTKEEKYKTVKRFSQKDEFVFFFDKMSMLEENIAKKMAMWGSVKSGRYTIWQFFI
jgi:hypothetical protein